VVFAVLSGDSDVFPVLPPGLYPFEFEGGRVVLNLIFGDIEDALESLLVCGEPALEKTLRSWNVDTWSMAGKPSMRLSAIMAMLSGLDIPHKPVQIKPKTPWHVVPKMEVTKKTAVVVGGGLAGCFTARALAKRGWNVRVLDSNPEVAMGASGNRHAVLYPTLSAHRSPFTTWMLHAFLYAAQAYRPWLSAGKIKGELNGILQFAVTNKQRASHTKLAPWLGNYPELGVFLNAEQASERAGLRLNGGGLWVPKAGWLDVQVLCQFLLDTPGITWEPNIEVKTLAFEEPVVILANGSSARDFVQTQSLPLSLIRGQLTSMASSAASSALKIPLCGAGHILPVDAHSNHWLGASYGDAYGGEDEENLAKLTKIPLEAQETWSHHVTGRWAGCRAKTPDHLPLVGPVPDVAKFKDKFSALAQDGGRFLPHAGAYWPGLYVCAGFGSRGLTSIPLAAEYLASSISGEPTSLPRHLHQALAPARFLVKSIQRKI